MATYQQGIHGRFSGRVGNVVGSSWKGKGVMRIRPASVSNPNTERQLNQRSRFGMAVRLVQANRELVKIGFRPWANGMSAQNAAVSYNLTNALTGVHPDVSIDFSRVMISRGQLAGVRNLTSAFTAPDTLTLQWDDNSAQPNAQAGDMLMVSLFDEEFSIAGIYPVAATRADTTAQLIIPEGWAGRSVQLLAFFLAANAVGTAENKQQVSDTSWGGVVALV